jgi:hypothetical protein
MADGFVLPVPAPAVPAGTRRQSRWRGGCSSPVHVNVNVPVPESSSSREELTLTTALPFEREGIAWLVSAYPYGPGTFTATFTSTVLQCYVKNALDFRP